RRIALGTLAMTAATALAACGVPIDRAPRALAPGDVPPALSAGTTTSTTEAGNRTPGAIALVQVYFVSADRLVGRGRVIPSPATVAAAVGSLLAGPTAAEAQ